MVRAPPELPWFVGRADSSLAAPGRSVNMVSAVETEHGGRASPPRLATAISRYTDENFEEVGRAVVVGLLDMASLNPWYVVPLHKQQKPDSLATLLTHLQGLLHQGAGARV